jgi:hypothetical protein
MSVSCLALLQNYGPLPPPKILLRLSKASRKCNTANPDSSDPCSNKPYCQDSSRYNQCFLGLEASCQMR